MSISIWCPFGNDLITAGIERIMAGSHGPQYRGDGLFVFRHDQLDHPFLAGDQLPQGSTVDIEETAQDSGGMDLQKLLDMPVKTFSPVRGKKKEPGNPVTGRNAFLFPGILNSPGLVFQRGKDVFETAAHLPQEFGMEEGFFPGGRSWRCRGHRVHRPARVSPCGPSGLAAPPRRCDRLPTPGKPDIRPIHPICLISRKFMFDSPSTEPLGPMANPIIFTRKWLDRKYGFMITFCPPPGGGCSPI